MNPLRLDSQYVYSKTPWLSWKELFFGLENGYIDKKVLSGYVCDALTNTSPPEAIKLAKKGDKKKGTDLFSLQKINPSLFFKR
jgi:hypothetical protein